MKKLIVLGLMILSFKVWGVEVSPNQTNPIYNNLTVQNQITGLNATLTGRLVIGAAYTPSYIGATQSLISLGNNYNGPCGIEMHNINKGNTAEQSFLMCDNLDNYWGFIQDSTQSANADIYGRNIGTVNRMETSGGNGRHIGIINKNNKDIFFATNTTEKFTLSPSNTKSSNRIFITVDGDKVNRSTWTPTGLYLSSSTAFYPGNVNALPSTGYVAGAIFYNSVDYTFYGATETVAGSQSWIRLGKPGD